jgi:YHS domain-containing protein
MTWTTLTRSTALALIGFTLALGSPVLALEPVFKDGGLAIRGHDPVAYFQEGRPVPGKPEFEVPWMGATWRFATAANRDAFTREPERYAPQYGGYCAWAVSQGYTASTDPAAWRIVDGRLYLNYDKGVQRRWEQDVPGNIAKGDRNWPEILKKP